MGFMRLNLRPNLIFSTVDMGIILLKATDSRQPRPVMHAKPSFRILQENLLPLNPANVCFNIHDAHSKSQDNR
eukprot:1041149-Amphidinium_carterae.2